MPSQVGTARCLPFRPIPNLSIPPAMLPVESRVLHQCICVAIFNDHLAAHACKAFWVVLVFTGHLQRKEGFSRGTLGTWHLWNSIWDNTPAIRQGKTLQQDGPAMGKSQLCQDTLQLLLMESSSLNLHATKAIGQSPTSSRRGAWRSCKNMLGPASLCDKDGQHRDRTTTILGSTKLVGVHQDLWRRSPLGRRAIGSWAFSEEAAWLWDSLPQEHKTSWLSQHPFKSSH